MNFRSAAYASLDWFAQELPPMSIPFVWKVRHKRSFSTMWHRLLVPKERLIWSLGDEQTTKNILTTERRKMFTEDKNNDLLAIYGFFFLMNQA